VQFLGGRDSSGEGNQFVQASVSTGSDADFAASPADDDIPF